MHFPKKERKKWKNEENAPLFFKKNDQIAKNSTIGLLLLEEYNIILISKKSFLVLKTLLQIQRSFCYFFLKK